jgi:oligopeptide/dipeptide ABC transporter ATP-binding protein
MNSGPALLQVRELEVTYPVRTALGRRGGRLTAVGGVSFELHRGRIFGLVGESGCGKSSLARAIIGLTAAAAGAVLYQQRELGRMDVRELRQTRRQIQYLFQDPLAALSPRRNIWQTLLEPLILYRIGNHESQRSRVENALGIVNLHHEVLTRFPHELSGGQCQRVALARALVAEPAVIIADEPMSSLDVSVQARMIALIRKVQHETGIAMLLISHDLAVVQQLADEVAVMYLGQIVEAGPAARVFSKPSHPYTRALFAAASRRHFGPDAMSVPLHGDPPSALTPPAGCVFHTRCPLVMTDCLTRSPMEANLAASSSGNHTVRCHLWNS